MKVLYVARLFSGFELGITAGTWAPTGAPTSYKVIEALDRSSHELEVVLTAKDGRSTWRERRDRTLRLEGLDAPVTVLAGVARIPRRLPRREHLRDLRQAWRVLRLARRTKPDLVYTSQSNPWAAAFAARWSGRPVVLRVMGAQEQLRDALVERSLLARTLRWAFRSPFALVLGTQDGSPIERWMDEALAPGVRRVALVNGVDDPTDVGEVPVLDHLPPDATVVLFLGRLEPDKAAADFLPAFLDAWRQRPELHALVVGTGSLEDAMRDQVDAAGATDAVTFAGALPHRSVLAVHARADVYVSVNLFGNLSTSNLEAMKAGACIVMPSSQPESGIDTYTNELIPDEVVWRLPPGPVVPALTDALVALAADPERRAAMGAGMARLAATFVPTWDERIATELALLEEVAR